MFVILLFFLRSFLTFLSQRSLRCLHAEIRWLVLDLVVKMNPGHCNVMIFDAVYEGVFGSEIFQRVNQASWFVIKISQDEDTLDPPSALKCVLADVRKAGCGGYIILLANGVQMERLLRFGDKTRIIDTGARFIMLHDYHLFVSQLHYLWKRIVNVMFVRRVRQKMFNAFNLDRSINSDSSPLYELSTVPFPIPIKGVFFTKIINFWQSGNFRFKNSAFFSNKMTNLGGQTMQVVVLQHTPAVFKTAISKAMHFQMNFYETADADMERWGTIRQNGTLTGLLQEMHEGRANFALADLHHTEYHLGFMDLSIPYNTECLTFLTPEALSDNSWKTLIMPFNGEMWAGVLLSLFSVGFVMYYKHKLQKLRMIHFKHKPEPWHDPLPMKDIFDSLAGCIIYTYSMLLLVSLPRLPNGWPLRVLTGWYWVYCVLVVVAYRASFTAILANPMPRLTIDTLQALAESPIRCGAWGEQNRLFFQKADDPQMHVIGAKLDHAPNPHKAVEHVVQGMYAYYENIYLLRQLRSTQKSEKARQTLHIMKQCAVHMPISVGLEKNSPIKPQVDRYIRALVEGGLTGKWLSDAIERFQSNVELPPQEATIDLTKMYAGIIALVLGYGISSIAFVAEKLYWAYFIKCSPIFDKYLLGIQIRKHG
uniref:Ionotropic glutamate receptor C-terminal domain-containing protein n=1 Tax=Anopheles atroparvus TaxID=41427 RepID=A0AAG5DE62_ANOAO